MNLILFLHIERTGGSTVNSWFGSSYEFFQKDLNYFEFPAGFNNLTFRPNFNQNTTYFISGHFSLATAKEFIPFEIFNKMIIVTVFRNPTERIISGFKLWLRSPEWFPELSDVKKNFIAYYERVKPIYSNNLMCRRLSESNNANKALNELSDNNVLVGNTDNLNLFAQKLLDRIKVIEPNINLMINEKKSNEGVIIQDKDYLVYGINEEILQLISQDNLEDIKLYNELFSKIY